jgi:hypothetical protein
VTNPLAYLPILKLRRKLIVVNTGLEFYPPMKNNPVEGSSKKVRKTFLNKKNIVIINTFYYLNISVVFNKYSLFLKTKVLL